MGRKESKTARLERELARGKRLETKFAARDPEGYRACVAEMVAEDKAAAGEGKEGEE